MVKNKYISFLIGALFGSIFCYFTLQFSFFKIKTEIEVIDTLINICTILIGIYIAHTIQIKVNKNQNQYSYLESKLDILWCTFNSLSQTISFSDSIEVDSYANFNQKIASQINFLKILLKSCNLNEKEISNLENSIAGLDDLIDTCPVSQNIISLVDNKNNIESNLSQININFSLLLKQIHNL